MLVCKVTQVTDKTSLAIKRTGITPLVLTCTGILPLWGQSDHMSVQGRRSRRHIRVRPCLRGTGDVYFLHLFRALLACSAPCCAQVSLLNGHLLSAGKSALGFLNPLVRVHSFLANHCSKGHRAVIFVNGYVSWLLGTFFPASFCLCFGSCIKWRRKRRTRTLTSPTAITSARTCMYICMYVCMYVCMCILWFRE